MRVVLSTVLIVALMAVVASGASFGPPSGGSGNPIGAAGGDLGGTFPNPTVTSLLHASGAVSGVSVNKEFVVAAAPYSATGDGATNDYGTATTGIRGAIAAAIAQGGGIVHFTNTGAAAGGSTVYEVGTSIGTSVAAGSIVPLTFRCDDGVTLQRHSTLGANAIFHFTGSAGSTIQNIRIENCTISNGTATVTPTVNQDGIRFDFVDHAEVKNNFVTEISSIGVVGKNSTYINVHDNRFYRMGYGHVLAYQNTSNWWVQRNKFDTTVGSISGVSYIVATGGEAGALANGIKGLWLTDNDARNNPLWECYDTHDAEDMWFERNVGFNCATGVILTAGTSSGNISSPSLRNVHAIGNDLAQGFLCTDAVATAASPTVTSASNCFAAAAATSTDPAHPAATVGMYATIPGAGAAGVTAVIVIDAVAADGSSITLHSNATTTVTAENAMIGGKDNGKCIVVDTEGLSMMSEGVEIRGNHCYGFGGAETGFSTIGSISLDTTKGIVVADNLIEHFANAGILLYYDVWDALIQHNTIRNAWTSAGAVGTACIAKNSYGLFGTVYTKNICGASNNNEIPANWILGQSSNIATNDQILTDNDVQKATTYYGNTTQLPMGSSTTLSSTSPVIMKNGDWLLDSTSGQPAWQFTQNLVGYCGARTDVIVTASITTGTKIVNTVVNGTGNIHWLVPGMNINITGAGAASGLLSTRILANDGSTLTVDVAAGTTVSGANVAINGCIGSRLFPMIKREQITATKTGTYTAVCGDYIPANGTFTITLPTAGTNECHVTVKNIGTGVVTIARAGSDTIDGATSIVNSTQYSMTDLVSRAASTWDVVLDNNRTRLAITGDDILSALADTGENFASFFAANPITIQSFKIYTELAAGACTTPPTYDLVKGTTYNTVATTIKSACQASSETAVGVTDCAVTSGTSGAAVAAGTYVWVKVNTAASVCTPKNHIVWEYSM